MTVLKDRRFQRSILKHKIIINLHFVETSLPKTIRNSASSTPPELILENASLFLENALPKHIRNSAPSTPPAMIWVQFDWWQSYLSNDARMSVSFFDHAELCIDITKHRKCAWICSKCNEFKDISFPNRKNLHSRKYRSQIEIKKENILNTPPRCNWATWVGKTNDTARALTVSCWLFSPVESVPPSLKFARSSVSFTSSKVSPPWFWGVGIHDFPEIWGFLIEHDHWKRP